MRIDSVKLKTIGKASCYAVIWFVITIFSAIIIITAYAASLASSAVFSSVLTETVQTEMIAQFQMQHAMTIALVSNVVGTGIFLLIWRHLDKSSVQPKITSISPLVMSLSTAALIGISSFFGTALDIIGLTGSNYEAASEAFEGGHIVVKILALCVFGPVVEELCYRGVMLRKMASLDSRIAIVASALIFAVLHLNFVQGINVFFGSLLLGYVAVKFKSIKYALIAHIALNTYALVCNELGLVIPQLPEIIISCSVVIVSLVVLIRSKINQSVIVK